MEDLPWLWIWRALDWSWDREGEESRWRGCWTGIVDGVWGDFLETGFGDEGVLYGWMDGWCCTSGAQWQDMSLLRSSSVGKGEKNGEAFILENWALGYEAQAEGMDSFLLFKPPSPGILYSCYLSLGTSLLVSQGPVERIDLELHVLQDRVPTDAQPSADVGIPSIAKIRHASVKEWAVPKNRQSVLGFFLSWRFLRSAGS